MLLSVLIPTIESRQAEYKQLRDKLNFQISRLSVPVEVLPFLDNKEHSIGFKRNHLIEQAQGKFIVFIDDDDHVSDDYIDLICRAIQKHPDIDCVGFKGTINFSGSHEHTMIHSLQYQRFFKKKGIYYRPIMHINPIRREIASSYKFEDINYSEDFDWAMRLQRDGVLKEEYLIDRRIYFYNSHRKWSYQVFIDATEDVRQALGLQYVNYVRARRWIKNILGMNRLLFL